MRTTWRTSASPVFNDRWEVVALHHSGVPRRNAEKKVLTIDGGLWTPNMGEHRIDWVANEGIRVAAIMTALKKRSLPAGHPCRKAELVSGPFVRSYASSGTAPGRSGRCAEVVAFGVLVTIFDF